MHVACSEPSIFLCQLSLVCYIKLPYSPLSISPAATIMWGSNATTSLGPSLMKWTFVPNFDMKMMVRCGFQEICYVQQCSTEQLWSYGSTNNSNICHVFWCWRQIETVTCVLFNFCFRLQLNEHQHENGIYYIATSITSCMPVPYETSIINVKFTI